MVSPGTLDLFSTGYWIVLSSFWNLKSKEEVDQSLSQYVGFSKDWFKKRYWTVGISDDIGFVTD